MKNSKNERGLEALEGELEEKNDFIQRNVQIIVSILALESYHRSHRILSQDASKLIRSVWRVFAGPTQQLSKFDNICEDFSL